MDHKTQASQISVAKELNQQVADQLREIGHLLEKQQANLFRVRAYYNAAITVERLDKSIKDIVEDEGIQGLVALPTIGSGIARSIYEYVAIGRMTRLDNLKGEPDPIRLFQSIPGVGPELASRIYTYTHAHSFEALEMSIHNGVLRNVPGLGEYRLHGIEAWILNVLGEQRVSSDFKQAAGHAPSIELLFKVDTEYREKVKAGTLPTFAPKHFNPEEKSWLPVLHTSYEDWHFTVLFSNTLLAHELKRTDDWVVIYFYDEHHQEGQYTVVTETRGPLTGMRVVRGRELDCREFYDIDEVS